jgi:hypothetical protein
LDNGPGQKEEQKCQDIESLQKEQKYRRRDPKNIVIVKKRIFSHKEPPAKDTLHRRIIAAGYYALVFNFDRQKLIPAKGHKIDFIAFGGSPIEDLFNTRQTNNIKNRTIVLLLMVRSARF